MKDVCHMFKLSRQALYKYKQRHVAEELQEEIILQLVNEIRHKLPRIGGRKLYHMLQEDFNRLPLQPGRDKFFSILRRNGLLVQRTRRYARTTQSFHRFRVYTNVVKDRTVSRVNEVFVADITYLRLNERFCYLFLVTDVYSRKIVGYNVSNSLAVEGALRAIRMALQEVGNCRGLIHHSDRGFQYCCDEYVDVLQSHGIELSMGEVGNPYDNAIAERVNGILKTEFFLNATFVNEKHAALATTEAVALYNDVRPHMSIGYMTPSVKYAA